MCLYPKLIKNRKYKPNKKNGGIVPQVPDERVLYVPVGCGKCMECLKQKARQWQVRLQEEIREDNSGQFVTLSFSEESLVELEKVIEGIRINIINEVNELNRKQLEYDPLDGYNLDNEIAKLAMRRFLERWRKKYKKSIKHWFVSELGHVNTERLHLHGILFTPEGVETIEKIWKYGNIWIGEYVNEQTINYIVKYIHKTDSDHKYYTPIILTSPGIGKGYMKRQDSKRNTFKDEDTNTMYKTRNGIELPLPIYYRNHLYTDDEKEILWLNLLDKQERYVNGIKVDVSENDDDYEKLLKQQRLINDRLGYGNDYTDEGEKEYERARRNLKAEQRKQKLNKKNNTPPDAF